jgi:hypothetical protein
MPFLAEYRIAVQIYPAAVGVGLIVTTALPIDDDARVLIMSQSSFRRMKLRIPFDQELVPAKR